MSLQLEERKKQLIIIRVCGVARKLCSHECR